MPAATRAQDDGRTLRTYFYRILVRCPLCDKRAIVRNIEDDGHPDRPFGVYRLQCESCTHRQDHVPTWYAFGNVRGHEVDPFFLAPLFLQIDTRLGTLFAFNEAHLDWLERFVSAELRERTHIEGGANTSMASRLPRWMKLAKNRDDVLQAIRKLRATLAT